MQFIFRHSISSSLSPTFPLLISHLSLTLSSSLQLPLFEDCTPSLLLLPFLFPQCPYPSLSLSLFSLLLVDIHLSLPCSSPLCVTLSIRLVIPLLGDTSLALTSNSPVIELFYLSSLRPVSTAMSCYHRQRRCRWQRCQLDCSLPPKAACSANESQNPIFFFIPFLFCFFLPHFKCHQTNLPFQELTYSSVLMQPIFFFLYKNWKAMIDDKIIQLMLGFEVPDS